MLIIGLDYHRASSKSHSWIRKQVDVEQARAVVRELQGFSGGPSHAPTLDSEAPFAEASLLATSFNAGIKENPPEIQLSAHNGSAAVTEFQKLLDHPVVVLNGITGALANLQLGRAYTMHGDTVKARDAYKIFSSSGKTPIPVPIYKQAKVEYEKLQ